MKYPSRSDYCSSIRNPQFAFRKKDPLTRLERDLDSSLVMGKPVERRNITGSPTIWSASGSFAVVFKYETFSPRKVWALRCFLRSNFEVVARYKKVLSRLKHNPYHSYFVEFSLLEEGIRVLGNCYPLLKMEWVEGENLKKFLKANLGKKNLLKSLAEQWLKLSQDLLSAGIAHGDLQHGNILIVNCFEGLTLKLIDYDSLYFAGDSVVDDIKGLSDYQHPLRQLLEKRCLEIDFFPQLVIYLSILALAENQKLWEIYRLDEREGLLFSRVDFQQPQEAEIFKTLSKLPFPIPTLADKLKTICQIKDFNKIPSLKNVLSNDESLVSIHLADLSEKPIFSSPPLIHPQLLLQKGKDWLKRNTFAQIAEAPLNSSLDLESSQEETEAHLTSEPYNCSIVRVQTPAFGKTLQWDPRSYQTHSLKTPENKSASTKQVDNSPHKLEKAKKVFWQIYTQTCQRGIGQFQEFQQKFKGNLKQAIATLKTKLEPKTWTTQEIASQLDRSTTWCHRQRYRFPDFFKQGIHYDKDNEGVIRWTKAGIRQLRRLHSSQKINFVPPTSFPTKEVSQRLRVTPEWILQTKTKYASQILEGSHYYIDARKRYYWTSQGIAHLQELLLAHPPKSSQAKTKKSFLKATTK